MSIECPTGPEFGPFIRRLAERLVVFHCGERWVADWMAAICCLESGWGGSVKGPLAYNVCGYHWVPGCDWSSEWIEAVERATGEVKRYRRFAGFEECLEALYYLITESSYYETAREQYRRDVEASRLRFMHDFSRVYCDKDAEHGTKVLRIFGGLRRAKS